LRGFGASPLNIVPWLSGDLYLRNARQANEMAARLGAALESVPGVAVRHPVESNAVFASLPTGVADLLRQEFAFSVWNERTGEVRLMCSFGTTLSTAELSGLG
jgi:threonine aldolase